MLTINNMLTIPDNEFIYTFSRSGGPGGQNVNKVETKVTVGFDVADSPTLTDTHKRRILKRLSPRIDKSGVLSVTAQDHRTQQQNRTAAEERLTALIRNALTPRKRRIPTKVPASARERRIQIKKRRGELKRLRGNVPKE